MNNTITINQQPFECDTTESVAQVLTRCELDKPGVAVALNNQVLPRAIWFQTQLSDKDQLSVFQPIAGG